MYGDTNFNSLRCLLACFLVLGIVYTDEEEKEHYHYHIYYQYYHYLICRVSLKPSSQLLQRLWLLERCTHLVRSYVTECSRAHAARYAGSVLNQPVRLRFLPRKPKLAEGVPHARTQNQSEGSRVKT